MLLMRQCSGTSCCRNSAAQSAMELHTSPGVSVQTAMFAAVSHVHMYSAVKCIPKAFKIICMQAFKFCFWMLISDAVRSTAAVKSHQGFAVPDPRTQPGKLAGLLLIFVRISVCQEDVCILSGQGFDSFVAKPRSSAGDQIDLASEVRESVYFYRTGRLPQADHSAGCRRRCAGNNRDSLTHP